MSKNSAIILVFGWSVVVLSVIGFVLLFSLKVNSNFAQESLLSSECRTGKTYYKLSDLSNIERTRFTNHAVALEAYGTEVNGLRIVLDFNVIQDIRNKIKIKLYMSKPGDKLGRLTIGALLNGTTVASSKTDIDSNFALYSPPEVELNALNNTVGVTLTRDGNCVLKVSSLANIDQNLQALSESDLIKFNSTTQLVALQGPDLDPGLNYWGSQDWMDISSFLESGLKVAFYEPSKKKWQLAGKIIQPNRGYVLYNPTKQKLTLDPPKYYRVPDDLNSPALGAGWNLLYKTQGIKIADLKVYLNADNENFVSDRFVTLGDLSRDGYISREIFSVSRGRLAAQSIDSITDDQSGATWVYMRKEPPASNQQINLSLKIAGADDSYHPGDYVPLKILVSNNSAGNHYLVSPKESDPCQIKIEIFDQKNKAIFDSSQGASCPLWPTLEVLPSGDKKEYNYIWKVPGSLSGKLQVKATLDYDRQGQSQLVTSSQVFIK